MRACEVQHSVFFFFAHSHEYGEHATSTALKASAQQHQQGTPCVCDTPICALLLWLVGFFGACLVSAIADPSFAATMGGIAILDENIRTVRI